MSHDIPDNIIPLFQQHANSKGSFLVNIDVMRDLQLFSEGPQI
jgi:hypothetical protein